MLDCTLRDGGYVNDWDLVIVLLRVFISDWKQQVLIILKWVSWMTEENLI